MNHLIKELIFTILDLITQIIMQKSHRLNKLWNIILLDLSWCLDSNRPTISSTSPQQKVYL